MWESCDEIDVRNLTSTSTATETEPCRSKMFEPAEQGKVSRGRAFLFPNAGTIGRGRSREKTGPAAARRSDDRTNILTFRKCIRPRAFSASEGKGFDVRGMLAWETSRRRFNFNHAVAASARLIERYCRVLRSLRRAERLDCYSPFWHCKCICRTRLLSSSQFRESETDRERGLKIKFFIWKQFALLLFHNLFVNCIPGMYIKYNSLSLFHSQLLHKLAYL